MIRNKTITGFSVLYTSIIVHNLEAGGFVQDGLPITTIAERHCI